MDVSITAVTAADVTSVVALARHVWEQTYPGIISREQIEFMLKQRYDPHRVLEELSMPQLWWEQVRVDAQLAGFACSLITARGEMKIDKLYVDPQRQRSGLGRRLLEGIAHRAMATGCTQLVLAVNKRNEHAIAAYRKYGFRVREAVCVDIGGGFVMDDFIMAKPLAGS